MQKYSDFITSSKKKDVETQNMMMFGEESEESEDKSDDLKRKSVMEADIDHIKDHKKGAIKKGIDPDVGEYQIEGEFTLGKDMDNIENDDLKEEKEE
jgi:hypothetical protein